MFSRISSYIQEQQLPSPSEKILVAVSGGVDSVILLHILNLLGYSCSVLHCNFHLRNEESDRDERFVEELARKMNLPFFKADFDTKTYAANKGISIEMAARELRYEWFEKVRQEQNAKAIAVAHHADDSIETFLMNIVRGTGIHGLTGIKPWNNYIMRPLLCVFRQEIELYAQKNQLAYITDSSNQEEIYTRNKFRHSIIPLLETINPAIKKTLLSEMAIFRETEILAQQQIEIIKKKIVCHSNGNLLIDINLLKEEVAISGILFEILSPLGFSSEDIPSIIRSLDGISGKQFISSTHRLVKDRNFLIIEVTEPQTVSSETFSINKNQSTITHPIKLCFDKLAGENFKIEANKNIAYFDADKLQFPLTIRKWKKGDVFIPFGMKGLKKLSDYFIDNKFSLVEKENTYLLCSGENIIWIVGKRTDNRYRVENHTQSVLRVCISE